MNDKKPESTPAEIHNFYKANQDFEKSSGCALIFLLLLPLLPFIILGSIHIYLGLGLLMVLIVSYKYWLIAAVVFWYIVIIKAYQLDKSFTNKMKETMKKQKRMKYKTNEASEFKGRDLTKKD